MRSQLYNVPRGGFVTLRHAGRADGYVEVSKFRRVEESKGEAKPIQGMSNFDDKTVGPSPLDTECREI